MLHIQNLMRIRKGKIIFLIIVVVILELWMCYLEDWTASSSYMIYEKDDEAISSHPRAKSKTPFQSTTLRGKSSSGQPRDGQTSYSLPSCSCVRVGRKVDWTSRKRNISTCSDFSTQRGQGQKVVAYSYFNPSKKSSKGTKHSKRYLLSLLDRAKEVRKLYPGWVMRVYHNVSTTDHYEWNILCQLFCFYNHVDLCDVQNIPLLGAMAAKYSGPLFRFLVMGDPTVEIFISRDSDSFIQPREKDAVDEWLKSDKSFHAMRDHRWHKAILAGLWGCKNEKRVAELARERNKIFSGAPNHTYGYDQEILRTSIWRLAQNDILQHDSYTCLMELHANSVPFPTKRVSGYYLGWGPVGKEIPLKTFRKLIVCPLECRPPEHQDWEMC